MHFMWTEVVSEKHFKIKDLIINHFFNLTQRIHEKKSTGNDLEGQIKNFVINYFWEGYASVVLQQKWEDMIQEVSVFYLF